MRTRFVLAILLAAGYLSAQTTSTLYGTVTDKSGAVIPGAQVTAVNTGTNLSRTAQTNAEGLYRFDFMPIGTYSIEVAVKGFKSFVQKGVTLDVNVMSRVDASLDVGQTSDQVEVTAARPLVNTTTRRSAAPSRTPRSPLCPSSAATYIPCCN